MSILEGGSPFFNSHEERYLYDHKMLLDIELLHMAFRNNMRQCLPQAAISFVSLDLAQVISAIPPWANSQFQMHNRFHVVLRLSKTIC